MRLKRKQLGISLMEVLVVVAIMAILMGISIPAAKQLTKSFESSTGARHLINAALSNARAIAVREQNYAGVRFQQDKTGNTYIIFIEHDPDPSPDGTGLANGFRAVQGRRPMKLPDNTGVISGTVNTNDELWGAVNWQNSTTFCVIFSPQGKLTVHPVRVRNKNGFTESTDPLNGSNNDTIFNTRVYVDTPNKTSLFYQDDYYTGNPNGYPVLGLGEENSVQSFIIFSKNEVNYNSDTLWSEYFSKKSADYVSPYTGELVMEYRD